MNVNSESRINSEQAKEAIYNAHTKLPIVYTKEEVDAIIGTLTSGGETTYNTNAVDTFVGNVASTLMPYSGYTQVSKKLDNFVFQTSSSFLNKVADKNRYVKFGDKVVDTYGEELITNGDFSDGTTGWSVSGATISVDNGRLKAVSNSTFGYVYKSIPTVAGKAYKLKMYFDKATGGNSSSIWISSSAYNANQYGSYNLNTLGTTGVLDIEIIATSTTLFISMLPFDAGKYCYFDNISVREIQTAQFEVPEVTEIITDGSNTTSVAVNAGDYVVDGSELVTNGTFDTDTSGWTLGTDWAYDSVNQRVYRTGTTYHNLYMTSTYGSLVSGEEYVISFETGGTGYIGMYTASGQYKSYLAGTYSVVFTYTSGTYPFWYSSSSDAWIDNISVKRVSDTFRATRDTADMYDLDDTNTLTDVAVNEVVYHTGVNTVSGTSGHFYKCLVSLSAKNLSSTSLFNDTSYFKDLGTSSSMSLDNPYFEDRTEIGVTNQQLSYHAYNTLTNSYEGIKTETLFSDVSKEDLLDNPTWLARNGFSKVSEYLYSKGSYLVLPVGIWQC